ncbi:MAG TPA: phospholipid carrier-dependent glycosyltransferase [Candidatus Aquilonibacter sp.]|nr:phospholipid carrier-dependent glycosyltransferase [Candidatus Aquilonibacter sp.]
MSVLLRSRDAAVACALGLASFVLLFVNYWLPPEKIFDEVYFARAAEEYLQRRYIYESTHPPVTKLLITLSVMLFGGLPAGDTSWGWRFLGVVAGAVAVVLTFVLARRVLGSTLFAAYAAALFACDGLHFVQSRIATPETYVVCFSLLTLYAFCRYWDAVADMPPGAALRVRDGIIAAAVAAVVAIVATLLRFPGDARYAQIVVAIALACGLYGAWRLIRTRPAGTGWLLLFAFAGATLVASKWYGVMAYGVATVVVAYAAIRAWRVHRPSPFPVDAVVTVSIAAIAIVYALAYIPHFIGLRDLQTLPPRPYTLTNVIDMQVGAYMYHAHLVATHPYASLWWTWPLDLRPVLYYASYPVVNGVAMAKVIYALPNPLLLWTGLIGVPVAAFLAIRERNRALGLVVLAYLLQWLPWAKSPRIAWIYHFYVDIPLIAVCNAAVVMWIWNRLKDRNRAAALTVTIGYLAVIAAAFVYFYPILAGVAISSDARAQRLWLPSWN